MASSVPTSRAYRGLDDDDEGYKAVVESVKRLVLSKTERLKSENKKLRERHNQAEESHFMLQLEMYNIRQAFGNEHELVLKEREKNDLLRYHVRELKLENATLKVTLADMEKTLRESGVELNGSNMAAEGDSSACLLKHRIKEMEGELRFMRIVNDNMKRENSQLKALLQIERLESAKSRTEASVVVKQEPLPPRPLVINVVQASGSGVKTEKKSQPKTKSDGQVQDVKRGRRGAEMVTATATSSQPNQTGIKKEPGTEASSGGRGEKRIIPDPSDPEYGKRVCHNEQKAVIVSNVLLIDLVDEDNE